MSIPYNIYVKVKNKYCIQYYGVEELFLQQLIKLKSLIKTKYPDVDVYISCKDEFYEKYKNDTISKSQTNTNEYAYIRNLTYNNVDNPVVALAIESNIDFQI